MKKKIANTILIALLLVITLSLSLISCKDKDGEEEFEKTKTYTIAVISDLHVTSPNLVKETTSENYVDYAERKKYMYTLADSILASTVDRLIEESPNAVLIAGDLTDGGAIESLNYVVAQLTRLENEGIEVFVTGGSEDYEGVGYSFSGEGEEFTETLSSHDDFKVKMAKFGYGQAIAKDVDTNSYVADLPDSDYRVLALDSICNFYSKYNDRIDLFDNVSPKVSDSTIAFIENALVSAQNDGKQVVALSYLPIINDVSNVKMSTTKYISYMDRNDKITSLLSNYGVKSIFTGERHAQKRVEYVDEQNGTMTDYHIGTLSSYPNPILYMNEYDNDGTLVPAVSYLSSIKAEYINTQVVSQEVVDKVTTDLTAYGKEFIYERTITQLLYEIDDRGIENYYFYNILRRLKLSDYKKGIDDLTFAFGKDFRNVFLGFLNMPIYGETDSVESVCNSYGITLPKTQYTTVYDMLCSIICDVYRDDLQIKSGDDNSTVARYIIYTGCKKLADFDLFGRLKDFNDSIKDCDLHPMTDKLFAEDILDVKLDDALLSIISLANVPLYERIKIPLKSDSMTSALSALETLFNFIPFLLKDYYNKNTGELWGVKLSDYINAKEGVIMVKPLFDKIIIDVIMQSFAGQP